jgi:hypothetical protein
LDVEVNAPLATKLTAPLVAIAPVVAEVARKILPEVKPVEVESIFKAIPVVSASAEMFWTVPAVVESAYKLSKPPLELVVYAPEAVKLTIPLVATAPVVADVIFNNDPDVSPVPVEEIKSAFPVVSPFPVMR